MISSPFLFAIGTMKGKRVRPRCSLRTRHHANSMALLWACGRLAGIAEVGLMVLSRSIVEAPSYLEYRLSVRRFVSCQK
jgi:hypothetical protein